jgi:hypothetical protein
VYHWLEVRFEVVTSTIGAYVAKFLYFVAGEKVWLVNGKDIPEEHRAHKHRGGSLKSRYPQSDLRNILGPAKLHQEVRTFMNEILPNKCSGRRYPLE